MKETTMDYKFNTNLNGVYLEMVNHLDNMRIKQERESREKADMLEHMVKNNDQYRANPDNKYHNTYQRAVNHRFAFMVSVFVLTWVTVLYGWQPALAVVVGVLTGLGILAVSIVIFPMVLEMIHEFRDWIDGY
jgi:hypothetical protein